MARNQTTFKPGEGGRPKGAINKTAKQIKKVLGDVLSHEIESIPERLNQLSDKDRLEIVIKLIPYILPKPKEDILINKSSVNIPFISWASNKPILPEWFEKAGEDDNSN